MCCCHDIAPEDETGDLESKKEKEKFLKMVEEQETEELLRGFCNG
jgi:hypothetical protein